MDEQLKELLVERLFLDVEPADIDSNADLAEYGVDSFLLLELLVAIEEMFEVRFQQTDINAEALSSIASLRTLIQSKQS